MAVESKEEAAQQQQQRIELTADAIRRRSWADEMDRQTSTAPLFHLRPSIYLPNDRMSLTALTSLTNCAISSSRDRLSHVLSSLSIYFSLFSNALLP
ncbi:hypothetical protein QQG55_10605 [Brugia pahangi]